jgi:hypothetical protein
MHLLVTITKLSEDTVSEKGMPICKIMGVLKDTKSSPWRRKGTTLSNCGRLVGAIRLGPFCGANLTAPN